MRGYAIITYTMGMRRRIAGLAAAVAADASGWRADGTARYIKCTTHGHPLLL